MNKTIIDSLVEFTRVNGYYTIPILGITGFLTNSICLNVFFDKRFKERKKFKYVILKLFIDLVGCVYLIGFQNFIQCLLEPHVLRTNYCISTGSIYFMIWRLYIYRYANYMFYIWSGVNEILVNYDRLLMVKNTHNLFNKKNGFAIVAAVCCLGSFALFIPNFFAYNIIRIDNTTNVYFIQKTPFGNTHFFQLYVLAILSAGNILSTLFLLLSGFKLYYEFRKFRLRLTNLMNQSNQTPRTTVEITRQKAEIRIIMMVLTMCFFYTVLRLVDFVYTVNNSLFLLGWVNNVTSFVYMANFWYIWGGIVLNTNLFVLLKFNKTFRVAFHNNVHTSLIFPSTQNT